MKSRQFRTGQRYGRARVATVAAAITAVGLLGSGCSLANFNPTSEPTREVPPPPDLSTPDLRQGTLTGLWRGSYTCNQGLTQLSLTLVQKSSGKVTGIFRFSPGANSNARSGSYTVSGVVTGRSLVLRGDSWINRPGDYEMVGMNAQLSATDPDRIQGTIHSPGCTTFTLRRT